MLCSWSFILGFTEGIPDRILNINIFKIFVGDSICEVKVKFSICMKFFQKPLQILPTTFHSVSKRVNSQQSERALITNALKLTFRRGTCSIVRRSINSQCVGVHISSVISLVISSIRGSKANIYTNRNISSVYPGVINTMNSTRKRRTILIATGIYRRKYFVNMFICN